jgi:type IV pilus assembly protein PilB
VLRDHGYKAQFDIEAYEPVGCVRCAGMGYKGRIGLYEVMTMSDDLRHLTLQRSSADQLSAVAVREGMRKLREDGLDKVKAGLTSMAEIARVTGTG